MLARRSGRGQRTPIFIFSVGALGALAAACGTAADGGVFDDPSGSADTSAAGVYDQDPRTLPVVAQFEGGFDGENMWIRSVPVETGMAGLLPEPGLGND